MAPQPAVAEQLRRRSARCAGRRTAVAAGGGPCSCWRGRTRASCRRADPASTADCSRTCCAAVGVTLRERCSRGRRAEAPPSVEIWLEPVPLVRPTGAGSSGRSETSSTTRYPRRPGRVELRGRGPGGFGWPLSSTRERLPAGLRRPPFDRFAGPTRPQRLRGSGSASRSRRDRPPPPLLFPPPSPFFFFLFFFLTNAIASRASSACGLLLRARSMSITSFRSSLSGNPAEPERRERAAEQEH